MAPWFSSSSNSYQEQPAVKVASNGGSSGAGGNRPLSLSLGNLTDAAANIVVPTWAGSAVKGCLAFSIFLYVLNQKHLLPKPLAAIVSKVFFWPTLPLTAGKRYGKWSTVIDQTVMIGAAPFGFAGYPEYLYEYHGVRGVVNLCQEFKGPDREYKRLGIKHLRLPTVDHFEPTVEDMEKAVDFIQQFYDSGDKVYVHCRAGHGRSAAIVFAWLVSRNPFANLEDLNKEFCSLRNVRKTLFKQKNILEYHRKLTLGNIQTTTLLKGISEDDDDDDEDDSKTRRKRRQKKEL